jgi:hypothetical protein
MHGGRRILQFASLVACALVVAFAFSLRNAEAQASGGSIVVNVTADGAPAKADVVVKTATSEAQQVATGKAGAPISVADGTYDIDVTCTDLLDHPTQALRGVKVAGSAVARDVTFVAGTTTLNITKGGKALRGTTIKLRKVGGGEELPVAAKSGEAFQASPGNYEADVYFGSGKAKSTNTITGIQVYDGAKRSIPVNL